MADLGTPKAQVVKAHTDLATSNVECYAALGSGSKYVKVSAYNGTNQSVYITVGADNIDIIPSNSGIIIDSMETESALGVTPLADPTSGSFYMTAYTS